MGRAVLQRSVARTDAEAETSTAGYGMTSTSRPAVNTAAKTAPETSPQSSGRPPADHPERLDDSVEPPKADLPGQHRGMPAYRAQTERAITGEPHTPLDASVKESIELPHQRDEHVPMTADEVAPLMKQAHTDLAQGKQDTSRSVETDKAYHAMRPGKP